MATIISDSELKGMMAEVETIKCGYAGAIMGCPEVHTGYAAVVLLKEVSRLADSAMEPEREREVWVRIASLAIKRVQAMDEEAAPPGGPRRWSR